MTAVKINARDMIIEVGAGADSWIELAGLTGWTYDPSEDEEMAETTTFADKGRARKEKMQTGASAEASGFQIKDDETGEPDPGQAFVEDWHERLGAESNKPLRFRHFLDTQWTLWNATVTLGEQGGENNDKGQWSATFGRSGPSVKVPVAA